MPDWPRVMVKPFFSRMPVRYFEVSTSWKPSSPKLNTESTASWASLARPSTCSATPRFNAARLASAALGGAGFATGGVCASAVAALTTAAATVNPNVILRAIVHPPGRDARPQCGEVSPPAQREDCTPLS